MRFRVLALLFGSVLLAVAAFMPLAMTGGSAEAHVHGITPLFQLSCVVDNTITGANRTNTTPASATMGGPITGLIPRDVGNAPLTGGDGGFNAPVPVCD